MGQYSGMWQDVQEFAVMFWMPRAQESVQAAASQPTEQDQADERTCIEAITWCYQ